MTGTPGPSANIMDLTFIGLQAQLAVWKQPSFRALQLWEWLYTRRVADFDQMTSLPKRLRERLARLYRLDPLYPVADQVSADRLTRKIAFQLPDGQIIESVLMEYDRRHTVCVSSQVGCSIGCAFCATGESGFARNLSAGEIVAQPLYFARQLSGQKSLSNVVIMGMGEPLLNYDAVWQAIETWNDHRGFDLGARKITLSTAGYVPGIRQLAEERLQVGLAVSLHAAEDTLRDQLVPLNRTYPLTELLAACRDYVALTNRRITIEYALIKEVNDSVAQAHQVGKLLQDLLCHVNLIALNPAAESIYRSPPQASVRAFQQALLEQQIATTVRVRRGVDIQAGCGQLRHQVPMPSENA